MNMSVVEVKPKDGYTIWLRFDDGVEGEVDISDMIYDEDRDVLQDREVFEQVKIFDDLDTVGWSDDIDYIYKDELYMKITGLTMEELYPDRSRHVVEVEPREGYAIWLRFADGVEGEIDFSYIMERENTPSDWVFEAWKDREVFEQVSLLKDWGTIVWPGDIDMCPDALYMDVSGLTLEELIPSCNDNPPPESLEDDPPQTPLKASHLREKSALEREDNMLWVVIAHLDAVTISMWHHDYGPPHFHVTYNKYQASFYINPVQIRDGALPKPQLRQVIKWAKLYQDDLSVAWDVAVDKQIPPPQIPPL